MFSKSVGGNASGVKLQEQKKVGGQRANGTAIAGPLMLKMKKRRE